MSIIPIPITILFLLNSIFLQFFLASERDSLRRLLRYYLFVLIILCVSTLFSSGISFIFASFRGNLGSSLSTLLHWGLIVCFVWAAEKGVKYLQILINKRVLICIAINGCLWGLRFLFFDVPYTLSQFLLLSVFLAFIALFMNLVLHYCLMSRYVCKKNHFQRTEVVIVFSLIYSLSLLPIDRIIMETIIYRL